MMTWVAPTSTSMSAETSPVHAPSFCQKRSCAPMWMGVLLAAWTEDWRRGNGTQRTTSSPGLGFSSGAKSEMNCRACEQFLYIFQLAASSFERGIDREIE